MTSLHLNEADYRNSDNEEVDFKEEADNKETYQDMRKKAMLKHKEGVTEVSLLKDVEVELVDQKVLLPFTQVKKADSELDEKQLTKKLA